MTQDTGVVEIYKEEAQEISSALPNQSAPQQIDSNPSVSAVVEEKIALADDKKFIDPQDPNIKTPFRMLLLIGWDWILLILGVLSFVGLGILPIVFFFVLGDLIGALSDTSDVEATRAVVNSTALKMTYMAIGAFFAALFGKALLGTAAQRISIRTKKYYFHSIVKQEIGFFDMKSTGNMIKTLSEDIAKLTTVIDVDLMNISQSAGQSIFGFIMALITAYDVGLLGFTSLPLMFILIVFSSIMMDLLSKRSSQQLSKSVSTVNEVMSSMRTVRSMAGEEKELKRYTREIGAAGITGTISAFINAISSSLITFFIWGAVALAFWWAGKKLEAGTLEVSSLIKIWGFVIITVTGAQALLNNIPSIVKSSSSTVSLLNVIYRKPAIPYSGGEKIDTIRGHIVFENVTFRYPSRPKVAVLKNFTLDMQPGKSVALVGQSGSGKSTIVGLVEKWYEPEEGTITVDGVDLKTIDPMWLHRHVGIVSQEPTLFATTIYKNITYAIDTLNFNTRNELKKQNPNISEEEIEAKLIPSSQEIVEQAAKSANAHDFIIKLPEGYNTVLGERGVSLSGGQKQRIAIARSVLQNPSILLLDEATSALDTKSESLVQDALEKLMVNRTTIVVAHRLTTVQNCDMIVVMKQGVVVEKGTHNELINKTNGYYNALATKQKNFGKKSTLTPSQSSDSLSNNSSDEASSSESDVNSDNSATSATQKPLLSDQTVTTIDASVQPNVVIEPQLTKTKKISKRRAKKNAKNKQEFAEAEDIKDVHAPNIRSFLPIFTLFGADILSMPLFMFGAAGVGAAPLVTMLIFGRITNKVVPARNADGVLIPFPPGYSLSAAISEEASYVAIIAAAACVCQFLNNFFSNFASERFATRIKRHMFKNAVQQEMGYFDITKGGKILSIFSEDVYNIKDGFTIRLATVAQNLSQFIVGVILAFITSWQMSIIMFFVSLATSFLTICIVHAFVLHYQKKFIKYSSNSMVTASEVMGAIRTVRSMAGENREMKRFDQDADRAMIAASMGNGFMSASFGIVLFCIWAVTALAQWYGGNLLADGVLPAAALTQVTGNMTFAIMGLSLAMIEFSNVSKGFQSSISVLKIAKRKAQIPLRGGKTLPSIQGNVELENVDFAYPSRPNVIVMKNFSLKITKGQHVALVGESGSGKSTITGLIERFYDPLQGVVKIDGLDLKEADPEWLHRNVAIVTQEPVLFATTIRKNITYAVGDENVTFEQVTDAAKAANAHDFIMSLPDNYDTMIGERGVSMSGGQKQRVAIARAMLQNASLLLLDEATSALDTEAESLVQAALDKLMVGRTTIVIAHRLTTIQDCDVIVVMRAGEIVEIGNHKELIAKGGAYFKLAQKQMSFGSDDPSSKVTMSESD
ncbi:ATP-binding cassette, subfamily B [Acrasis kona]|uniref:ATP-binding cassette, subfamily B n=1 Tax=Acrasis kona TaxID=1008807 RepID=A0AAW2Z2F0_9EUKA